MFAFHSNKSTVIRDPVLRRSGLAEQYNAVSCNVPLYLTSGSGFLLLMLLTRTKIHAE